MTPFKLTDELVTEIEQLIENQKDTDLVALMEDLHYADVAEIIDELDKHEATYIIKLLESDKTSDVLTELDDDVREAILSNLSAKEIADELGELDTDDAADIVGELPSEIIQEVISELEDREHAKDIVDLLRYDEYSAGGLMAKELVKVKENWTVLTCVKEMRAQAENVTRVHSIYVVDAADKLKGRLSLKDLLTTSTTTHIKDVYIPKVDSVGVNEKPEEVAKIMQKYDLEAIPVVDEIGRLVGGVGAAAIMGGFEDMISKHAILFFFTPLIAAMAGNVGVQSSAIIVQGLANDDLKGSVGNRLIKEMLLALLNGIALAAVLLVFTWLWKGHFLTALTISLSLIAVILVAGFIGTFIPLFLHKRNIDPAIATGPFITTSNDIFGILIYFWIAKVVLGI